MFEHRLGLALGKTIGEIRALPAPEYRSWQIYNLVEPWGFEDREYRTAVTLTMLHNINAPKNKQKKPDVYMRNMTKLVSKELIAQKKNAEEKARLEAELETMTPEQQREFYLHQMQNVFGGKIIDKRKKAGDV